MYINFHIKQSTLEELFQLRKWKEDAWEDEEKDVMIHVS